MGRTTIEPRPPDQPPKPPQTPQVKAHYCALSHDRGGVCVPQACTAEDLHDHAILQPLMNLGVQAATTV